MQVLLTWECTIAHAIPWDTFFPWIKKDTDKARFVAAISKASIEHEYKLNRTGWIACDPLAVAVAIRPELIEEAQVQSFASLCAAHDVICMYKCWCCHSARAQTCTEVACLAWESVCVGTSFQCLPWHANGLQDNLATLLAMREMLSCPERAERLLLQELYCAVELHGSLTRGMSTFDWNKTLKHKPNVALVQKVNLHGFNAMMDASTD